MVFNDIFMLIIILGSLRRLEEKLQKELHGILKHEELSWFQQSR